MCLQISDIYISGESGDMSAKEKLLLWTQKVTAGYTGIKCNNFSSCWSDGKMFNALIHRYRYVQWNLTAPRRNSSHPICNELPHHLPFQQGLDSKSLLCFEKQSLLSPTVLGTVPAFRELTVRWGE